MALRKRASVFSPSASIYDASETRFCAAKTRSPLSPTTVCYLPLSRPPAYREVWRRSGGCLSVAEMGSRSVFLSGQAAKKNYEHPYAPSRSPLHHRPRVSEQVCKCQQNPGMLGWENRGILAGLCLKVENSRVAAIIGSYPAILPLQSTHTPKPGNKRLLNSSKTENKTYLNGSVCHIWHTEPN